MKSLKLNWSKNFRFSFFFKGKFSNQHIARIEILHPSVNFICVICTIINIFKLYFFTRLSEWGWGWFIWPRLRGKRSKDSFWTRMSEVVRTEASQAQTVQGRGWAQLLQKSWRRPPCSLVLHHWQEEKMGGVRRPKVWHRSECFNSNIVNISIGMFGLIYHVAY